MISELTSAPVEVTEFVHHGTNGNGHRSHEASSFPALTRLVDDRSVHDWHKLDALEAVLFAWHEPLPLLKLAEALEIELALAAQLLFDLEARLETTGGTRLLETPEGWRLVTKPEFAEYVERLREPQKMRLSKPSLETLAIVAYRQPVTRAEIDQIRGVDSSATLQTLIERGLIEATGRLDAPGRPVLYATTMDFLEHFGMKEVSELPELPESQLEEQARDLFDRAARVRSHSVALVAADRIESADSDAEPDAHSPPTIHEQTESGADTGDPELA